MLTIGSRGSALAVTQTKWVKERILETAPDARIEVKLIKTSADSDQKSSIRSGSATGVFVKEIEDALMAREIDLAVHSMKDVPTLIPDPLEIAAIPEREDPRDALVTMKAAQSLADLPHGSTVGTGSIRRQAQLLAARPDLKILDIRGNVDSRLRKMEEGAYDSIILACAGLNRLGLGNRITFPFRIDEMLPAPGQGALALQIRKGDKRTASILASLHHEETAAAVLAERAFLRAMGGGCNSPVAVHAWMDDRILKIAGLVACHDGTTVLREKIEYSGNAPEDAATGLAEILLSRGGRRILELNP